MTLDPWDTTIYLSHLECLQKGWKGVEEWDKKWPGARRIGRGSRRGGGEVVGVVE